VTGTLYRHGQGALMKRAGPGLPARLNLSTIGEMTTKPRKIFEINVADFVCAELTDFAARCVLSTVALALSAGRTSLTVSGRARWGARLRWILYRGRGRGCGFCFYCH
jgi:hypothetical protein